MLVFVCRCLSEYWSKRELCIVHASGRGKGTDNCESCTRDTKGAMSASYWRQNNVTTRGTGLHRYHTPRSAPSDIRPDIPPHSPLLHMACLAAVTSSPLHTSCYPSSLHPTRPCLAPVDPHRILLANPPPFHSIHTASHPPIYPPPLCQL